MVDAADVAQAFTEALVERGVRIVPANFTAVSLTHCEECDEVIPLRRRELLQKVEIPLNGGDE